MVLAVIGLGSVGYFYSEGLIANGAQVKGYDVMVGRPEFAQRVEQCKEIGIQVVSGMEELIRDADMVMAVTTAASAYKTAASAKPFLRSGQIYIELNSAVPRVKKEIEALLEGIDVVDGTTMSSVNQVKYRAEINFSGKRAKEVVDTLKGYGMNAHYLGDAVGKACALKSVRSIFMKGYEAVLMECFQAAEHYGITDEMAASIAAYFDARPFDEHLSLFITTNAIFAQRRGEEVAAVADMLREDGLNGIMAQAAADKLLWLSSLGLKEVYRNDAPKDRYAVLKELVVREARQGGQK